MAQMIQRGSELLRINTQKNDIEYSKDGGRSWHIRFASSIAGSFVDLFDNGSEILGCTSRGIYVSKDEGHSWHSRCTSSLFGSFVQLASNGQSLLAKTSRGLYYSNDGGRSWHHR